MNNNCIVYEIKVFGKLYIGFTKQKFKHRLQQHINTAVRNTKPNNKHFYSSLRAWLEMHKNCKPIGKILWSGDCEVTGLLYEMKFIKEKKSIAYGYNISPGGEGRNFHVKDCATKSQIISVFGNLTYFAQCYGEGMRGKTMYEMNSILKTQQEKVNINEFFSAYQFNSKQKNDFHRRIKPMEQKKILLNFNLGRQDIVEQKLKSQIKKGKL